MQSIRNRFLRHIATSIRISPAQAWRLIVPSGRTLYMRHYAASLIIIRVQLISAFFALVVPLWSIVDLLVFDMPVSLWLMLLRFLSALVFVFLAWPRKLSDTRPYTQAIILLLVMMTVPAMFYIASIPVLELDSITNTQQMMIRFYTFMPTIVLGGLAVFPLTAIEIVLLSLPVLAATFTGFLVTDTPTPGESITVLWAAIMMMGISIFSGMSQSHHMEGMMHQAMTDPLTGAASRGSGMEILKLLFHLSAISKQPLSVAFFDIDHFKRINDTYGHDTGDRTLQQVAEHLRSQLRHSDTLVRWGGEEFLALLPNMPSDQLPVLIERLKAGGFGKGPGGEVLTVSIGIAETLFDKVLDWHSLVELADRRMYEAKHRGRACALLPGNATMQLGPDKLDMK